MTLQQYQSLRLWHTHHANHPLEKNIWDTVLTLWMSGWVGGAAALVLSAPLASLGCLALLFLPNAYVGLRARLHRQGRLRCDWISAVK
jgi:hypothetical protein